MGRRRPAPPPHAGRQLRGSVRVYAPLKARQLTVLLDGAITHAFVHGDPDYALAAARRFVRY